MREPYDFNVGIRTLKRELPETSLISIGDDACLFNIKYNGIDDKFSKPIRLVGRIANSELPMYKDAIRSLISSMVSIAAGRWIADINRLRDEKVVKLNSRTHNDNLPCHFLH